MRTIVALAFTAFVWGQNADQAARLEKQIAADPVNVDLRVRALRNYYGNPAVPIDATSRTARRRHILWLIEHHPDAADLATYIGVLEPEGPKADPEGNQQSERLWRDLAGKPDASPKGLANAAWFFKMSDRAEARSLLERAGSSEPHAAKIRAILDVLAWLGATEMERYDTIARFDPELHRAPAAAKALDEIESSESPALIGSAGQFLFQQNGLVFQNAMGDTDPLDVAERWLNKAHQLEPGNSVWTTTLADLYQRESNATLDPRGKAQLLKKAIETGSTSQRKRFLADLADAEFRAADNRAAERDAAELLSSGDPDSVHAAHTILGRVALDRGDVASASEHLLESARTKGSPVLNSFGPKKTLAQDLLDRGERDVVVQYLELCRAFWKNDRGFIDHFEPIIEAGGKPDLLAFYAVTTPATLVPKVMPAPEVLGDLRWRPVAGAVSYIVEWDSQEKGRWTSDVDGSVRVIPTRETWAKFPEAVSGPIRWRVFAVSRVGRGTSSNWRTVDLQ